MHFINLETLQNYIVLHKTINYIKDYLPSSHDITIERI